MTNVYDIALVVVTLAAIPATATVIIYGFGSPWWTSWLGRVMFAKWLSVALVLIFIITRRMFGDYPGFDWIGLAVYSFMLLTFSAATMELLIERRGPDDGSITPHPKEKAMADKTLAVPDIWYKAQRVARTVVAFLVTAIPTLNLTALAVSEYLRTQEDVVIPGWVFVWLNAIIAGSALIIGLITRIMAVPGVNAWLTKIGLGSVPKDAVEVVNDNGHQVPVVAPDPKADTGHGGPVG